MGVGMFSQTAQSAVVVVASLRGVTSAALIVSSLFYCNQIATLDSSELPASVSHFFKVVTVSLGFVLAACHVSYSIWMAWLQYSNWYEIIFIIAVEGHSTLLITVITLSTTLRFGCLSQAFRRLQAASRHTVLSTGKFRQDVYSLRKSISAVQAAIGCLQGIVIVSCAVATVQGLYMAFYLPSLSFMPGYDYLCGIVFLPLGPAIVPLLMILLSAEMIRTESAQAKHLIETEILPVRPKDEAMDMHFILKDNPFPPHLDISAAGAAQLGTGLLATVSLQVTTFVIIMAQFRMAEDSLFDDIIASQSNS